MAARTRLMKFLIGAAAVIVIVIAALVVAIVIAAVAGSAHAGYHSARSPPPLAKPLTWLWLAEPAQRCCPMELSRWCGKKDGSRCNQRLEVRRT